MIAFQRMIFFLVSDCQAHYDIHVKDANLHSLAKKLEKCKQILAHNSEMHAEDSANMKNRISSLQEERRVLEKENQTLRSQRARPTLLAVSDAGEEGSEKVLCKCCGELMFVTAWGGSGRPVAGSIFDSGVESGNEVSVQDKGQDEEKSREIQQLKQALELANEKAERFVATCDKTCETLQDRISEQLSRLSRAEAEKAMMIAQHKFESEKVECLPNLCICRVLFCVLLRV